MHLLTNVLVPNQYKYTINSGEASYISFCFNGVILVNTVGQIITVGNKLDVRKAIGAKDVKANPLSFENLNLVDNAVRFQDGYVYSYYGPTPNISKSASYVTYVTKIEPGETYSFNETVYKSLLEGDLYTAVKPAPALSVTCFTNTSAEWLLFSRNPNSLSSLVITKGETPFYAQKSEQTKRMTAFQDMTFAKVDQDLVPYAEEMRGFYFDVVNRKIKYTANGSYSTYILPTERGFQYISNRGGYYSLLGYDKETALTKSKVGFSANVPFEISAEGSGYLIFYA